MGIVLEPRLASIAKQIRLGHFRDALEQLSRVYKADNELDRLLMAEVRLRLGAPDEARAILAITPFTRTPREWQHARYLELSGWAAKQSGDLTEAVGLLTRSVGVAETAADLEQLCRSQLGLLSSTVELAGPDSVASLASAVRRNVLRLGRPDFIGALHVRFAEVEARRGALDLAERHLAAAFIAVASQENLWVEAQAHLLLSVIGGLRSRLPGFKHHSEEALTIARRSGNRVIEFAALSNLGLACVLAGEMADAERYLRAAKPLADRRPYDAVNCLDNLAQLEMLRGNWQGCLERLENVKAITGSSLAHQPWARLASNVTLVKYLIAVGRVDDTIDVAEESRDVAHRRRDRLLEAQFNVACASLRNLKGQFDEATDLLDRRA